MYVRLQKLNTGGDAGLRYVELMHELQKRAAAHTTHCYNDH